MESKEGVSLPIDSDDRSSGAAQLVTTVHLVVCLRSQVSYLQVSAKAADTCLSKHLQLSAKATYCCRPSFLFAIYHWEAAQESSSY